MRHSNLLQPSLTPALNNTRTRWRPLIGGTVLGSAVLVASLALYYGLSSRASTPPSADPIHSFQEDHPLPLPLKNPSIVVYKGKRQLELFANGKLVRTYRVGLGFNPVDDKTKEGDGCTPEGEFYVFVKNPRSAYYLSLGLSYPNIEDAERGLRDRMISKALHKKIVNAIRSKKAPPQYTPLGGLIYIHGNGSQSDWTWGCVALDNEPMKELFDAVQVGTRVQIHP